MQGHSGAVQRWLEQWSNIYLGHTHVRITQGSEPWARIDDARVAAAGSIIWINNYYKGKKEEKQSFQHHRCTHESKSIKGKWTGTSQQ